MTAHGRPAVQRAICDVQHGAAEADREHDERRGRHESADRLRPPLPRHGPLPGRDMAFQHELAQPQHTQLTGRGGIDREQRETVSSARVDGRLAQRPLPPLLRPAAGRDRRGAEQRQQDEDRRHRREDRDGHEHLDAEEDGRDQ